MLDIVVKPVIFKYWDSIDPLTVKPLSVFTVNDGPTPLEALNKLSEIKKKLFPIFF